MRRMGLVLLAIALLLGTFGCVPTPEADVVVNKNDGIMQEAIYAAPIPDQPYEAPESVQMELIGWNGCQVVVDAEVVVPDVTKYPVVEISQEPIKVEQARDYMRRMSFGQKLYTYESELPQTKAEIMTQIRMLLEILTNPEEHFSASLSEEELSAATEELQKELEIWEAEYQKAPDVFVPQEIDIDTLEFNPLSQEMKGAVPTEFDFPIRISVQTNGIEYNNLTSMGKNGIAFEFDYHSDFTNLVGVTISKEEAIQKAKEFLNSLGISNFEPSCVSVGYDDSAWDKAGYTGPQQSIVIWFTPTIHGVPTTYRYDSFDNVLGNLEERQYAPMMWYEYITVQVKDDGVEYMYWVNPTTITATLNENVALLPFSEILDRFQQQMQVQNIPVLNIYSHLTIQKRTIHIDRIVLGMMQVRKKNYPDTIQMIPTWTFFGTDELEYDGTYEKRGSGGEQTNIEEVAIPGHSYLILNAIDGSVINPKYGY